MQLKTAAMLAKTKMKLSANGDRGVPEESRFYLRVLLDTATEGMHMTCQVDSAI